MRIVQAYDHVNVNKLPCLLIVKGAFLNGTKTTCKKGKLRKGDVFLCVLNEE